MNAYKFSNNLTYQPKTTMMMKKILLFSLLLFISAGLQAQWDKIYTHDEEINAVDAVTPDTVYVAGLRCAIRSLDGGQTWQDLHYNFENFVTLDIDFPTLETGYLLGRGGVLKTSDYGETWRMVAPDSIEYLKASFISADTGWIIGESWETHNDVIIRTYDGGENWTFTYLPLFDEPTDIQMINSKIGYITHFDVILANAGVLKTIDGGNTWIDPGSFDISDGFPRCCSFINQDTGYIGASGLYRTEDGGNNWTFVTSEHAIGLYYGATLKFLNYDTGYYAAFDPGYGDGVLCTSSDAGNNWMKRMDQYIDIDMVNDNVGYAIEWTGEIYKTTEGGLYVDIKEQKASAGKLLFPNPFSEEITLDLSALGLDNEEVIFEMFSVDGRKLLEKKINTQQINVIGTSSLNPGMYLYRVYSDKKEMRSGKIMKLRQE